MNIFDLLKTPIEELKKIKNVDYNNIRIPSNDTNVLFICNDIEKLKFFIENKVDVNHISAHDLHILDHSQELEKFKLMSSLVKDEILYKVNNSNLHFISDLNKDALNHLLTKTNFNLNYVIKNLDKKENFHILKSLLMNENKGVPSLVNKKLKNKKLPFYFFDKERDKKIIYLNFFRDARNLKTCFECMPELYNLFNDKNYEDRDFYLKNMDSNSSFDIEEMNAVFYEVKAKREKAILLKENLLSATKPENIEKNMKMKKRI